MILDEVLQEENRSFDVDDMVDIFTEGFLYALEMQEAGYKAGSTEDLSEKLVEGDNIAISELSNSYKLRAAGRAIKKSRDERLTANRLNRDASYVGDNGKFRGPLNDKEKQKQNDLWKQSDEHKMKSNKYRAQAYRIASKVEQYI